MLTTLSQLSYSRVFLGEIFGEGYYMENIFVIGPASLGWLFASLAPTAKSNAREELGGPVPVAIPHITCKLRTHRNHARELPFRSLTLSARPSG